MTTQPDIRPGDGDPERVIGTVQDIHRAPLEVAVYRGTVNIAGRHLDRDELARFARLVMLACWEAATWKARGGQHDPDRPEATP